jgi:hypothetical protein
MRAQIHQRARTTIRGQRDEFDSPVGSAAGGTSTEGRPRAVALPYGVRNCHRARLRRVTVLVIPALAVLGVVASHWFRPAWSWARYSYLEWSCLHYSAPPEQIVVVEAKERAVTEQERDDLANVCSDEFGDCLARRQPSCWRQFATANGWTAPGMERVGAVSEAPLFLHLLLTPTKRERLVLITGHVISRHDAKFMPGFRYCITAPGTPARYLVGGLGNVRNSRWPDPMCSYCDRLVVYAGQSDPADASHFTIRYSIDGSFGTIDGWLNDADDISMQVRDGPGYQMRSIPTARRAASK